LPVEQSIGVGGSTRTWDESEGDGAGGDAHEGGIGDRGGIGGGLHRPESRVGPRLNPGNDSKDVQGIWTQGEHCGAQTQVHAAVEHNLHSEGMG